MVAFVALWAMVDGVAGTAIQHLFAWQVVWVRYSVHLLIVLALWGRRGPSAPWRTRHLRAQLVRSSMMLIMPASFAIAITHGATANMVFGIFWCAPLLVLAFASVISRERPSVRTWLAAGLGWAGAWLYLAPDGVPSRHVIALSVAMAGSFALYVVMTRELRAEPLRVNLFYTAVVPWVALLPMMPRDWVAPTHAEAVALLFIGAAGWLALLALDRAAEAAPVSDTAPMLTLQIASIAIFATLVHHGISPHRLLASAALVAAATALGWHAIARPPMVKTP